MHRIYSLFLMLAALLLQGCTENGGNSVEKNDEAAVQRELDTQLEVMHQTREVIQYTIEQEALEQERLRELDTAPTE